MNVPARSAVFALLLLSACKVELTPSEYFDHATPVRERGEAAAAEVRDRVVAMSQALSRGAVSEAMVALEPAPEATLVGAVPQVPGEPHEQIQRQLEWIAGKTRSLEPEEVVLGVTPGGNGVWFRTRLRPADENETLHLLVTGVFVLREGRWRLVQAHFSTDPNSDPAGGAYPATGEARAGGG